MVILGNYSSATKCECRGIRVTDDPCNSILARSWVSEPGHHLLPRATVDLNRLHNVLSSFVVRTRLRAPDKTQVTPY